MLKPQHFSQFRRYQFQLVKPTELFFHATFKDGFAFNGSNCTLVALSSSNAHWFKLYNFFTSQYTHLDSKLNLLNNSSPSSSINNSKTNNILSSAKIPDEEKNSIFFQGTSRERHKSAPYLRLKNSKRT